LRVLVVGHGLIGRKRAAALHEIASRRPVVLAGTVDPRFPGEPHGSEPHWGDLGDVPEDAYDAAVIAMPHHLARPAALAILGRGRPVLVEKPLGLTAEEAREIAAAAEAPELPSFVGFNYRFLPMVREILATAAAGGLGTLRSIDIVLGHGGNPDSSKGWKLSPEQAGGGVLLDPGVHAIDIARQLAPGLVPAFAAATDGFWGTGVEEDAVAVLIDGGLIATLRVSHVRWVNTLRLEVSGEDGYAIGTGRGGTYGPQRVRLGRRWGWRGDSGRTQRETERVLELSDDDRSLADELEAVVARWLGATSPPGSPRPATMAEAVAVAEIWAGLAERADVATDRVPGH
jgi:predicted dehydrogenase